MDLQQLRNTFEDSKLLIEIMRTIHWNCRCTDFFRIHELTDSYISQLSSDIDILGEVLRAKHILVSGTTLKSKELDPERVHGMDHDGIYEYLFDNLLGYLELLEACRNIDSRIDDMYAYWSTEVSFKLASVLS